MASRGMLPGVLVIAGWFGLVTTAAAQGPSRGTTYIIPSYHLVPPVVTYGPPPVWMLAEPVVIHPVSPPVVAARPYVWPYAPPVPVVGYARERVSVRPRETEYELRTYSPYGRPISRYEVEFGRRGVEVEYRVR